MKVATGVPIVVSSSQNAAVPIVVAVLVFAQGAEAKSFLLFGPKAYQCISASLREYPKQDLKPQCSFIKTFHMFIKAARLLAKKLLKV